MHFNLLATHQMINQYSFHPTLLSNDLANLIFSLVRFPNIAGFVEHSEIEKKTEFVHPSSFQVRSFLQNHLLQAI